jgi:DNA-binding winged helix-turn-helix (wHTH) protein/TolB-like protein
MNESVCLYNYRFGRFELQPSERRLLAAGVPAVLEPRAFDVLVALVERAGHLVTKEELLRLVWPKLIVEDANLHVQVSALRKILGPAAIATIPGQGYRFTMGLTREVVDSVVPVAATRTSREPLLEAAESIDPVPARTNVVPLLRPIGETVETAPSAHGKAAPTQPSTDSSRWPWIIGAVAMILIAATAWIYETTKTAPQTTATTGPPTLSIAILPLVAPDDEQLAATLMSEINAALWRNARSAKVAAPDLVASYQGKQLDARAIGHELNVRYVAKGEIRRAGDTRLLSMGLIDVASGAQIWSERFDVSAEQLPASVDALATRVARRIWVALFRAEKDRIVHQPQPDLNATDTWLRGAAINYETLEGARAARKYLLRALELDPSLIGAMLNIGFTYETELEFDPHVDGDRIRRDFEELSLHAVATDRSDPRAWQLRTMALVYNNHLDAALDAVAEWKRIEPNHVDARGWRGVVLIAQGRSEEALAELDEGIALDPSYSNIGFLVRQKCKAYAYLGQYEKAIATCERATTDHLYRYPFLLLTAAYAQLGEMDKAAAAKTQLLKLNPGFTIDRLWHGAMLIRQNPIWMHQAETYVIPGLRKAGIPEK